jgi:hypothetical protein
MAEKKMFATRIDVDLKKKLKLLSVEEETSIADLAEEAIRDLLTKYQAKKDP